MEILKNKNLVSKILSHFSKLSTLPKEGFLAGGAVANYILELEWGGSYPINDLDIFIETKIHKETNTPSRTQELVLVSGYNYFGIEYDYESRYQIKEVETEGIINRIYVQRWSTPKEKDYTYILKGFDFNCCQVGIDLNTSKLVYTKEFEEFLSNKQLKVTGPYTPPHSVIRLFKKMDELKCYCDVESQMKLLSQPYHFKNIFYHSNKIFGLYFGLKYKELYNKYEDRIKPYFKLLKFSEYKILISNKINELEKNVIDIEKNVAVYNHIPEYLIEDWINFDDKIWALYPTKYTSIDHKISTICEEFGNPLRLITSWNLIYGKNDKSLVNKVNIALTGKYTKMITLVNLDFVDCDFDKKSVDELNKFCMHNFNIMPIVHKLKINLQESIKLQKDLKKIINKEGVWYEERLFRILENATNKNEITYEYLVSQIETLKESMNTPLNEYIDLGELYNMVLLPKNVTIKQINTECDLAWAGKKLKNCLNNTGQNYINKIKDGKVKIFVIITDESMSAIEFLEGIESFKEKQFLSYCNKIVSNYHRHIGTILKSYLNMNKLTIIYNNRIEMYHNILDKEQDELFCCEDDINEFNETGIINFEEVFNDEDGDYDIFFDDMID